MQKLAQNHKLVLVVSLVILLVIGFIVVPSFNKVGNHWKGYEEIPYELQGRTYKLLVADTEEKRHKGLMDVTVDEMNGFDGMIFKFNNKDIRSFWNRNTRLDLDVYWIADGKVIGKDKLPAMQGDNEVIISAPQPVNTVIEIVKK
jgi:hypothetical protein